MSDFSKDGGLDAQKAIKIDGKNYHYFDINEVSKASSFDIHKLPYTLKILLENLLRHENTIFVNHQNIVDLCNWLYESSSTQEIAFHPSRVLMQDFTGVPAVVDLAAMRDACEELSVEPSKINPHVPVDLVIDHSVQVDSYANDNALSFNVQAEFKRNCERYEFLKWGQKAFDNFRVVPPGNGICHQVNLEYLAKIVWQKEVDGKTYLYPDTLVGTDSHTTMVNALAVLGWGVGGIEAEAAMLGQPISMLIPDVIGVKLTGSLKEGITATDLVLTITNLLRKHNVVGKLVEFVGDGLSSLTLADRATISNMAPEYGATCGFFPVDDETLKYMELTGRSTQQIELVREYCKAQGLFRDESYDIKYTSMLELDLSAVEASLAGPKRPQDRVNLKDLHNNFAEEFDKLNLGDSKIDDKFDVKGRGDKISNGDVVISAITSCTNTSNPYVLIAAGLLAKRAVELGLKVKPFVKTSFAPGSKAVTQYLEDAGLQHYLDVLGYNTVGYGCTTCIGNSGPLDEEIEQAILDNKLVVTSVLSGNRNFEGRIHPFVRANYLASPPLCIAYAILGNIGLDIYSNPLGKDSNGKPVYLKDIWPSSEEINGYISRFVKSETFRQKYSDIFDGGEEWDALDVKQTEKYSWDSKSTYISKPPFFENNTNGLLDIVGARILMLLGDSITTDHISPAGRILEEKASGKYLLSKGVSWEEFNSYGARRGNHEVMARGTFANVRIKNLMLKDGREGGFSYNSSGEIVSVYDASADFIAKKIPLVVFAGKEYGTGSSRDWAAKGTKILGVKCVIAESFERIHRSNIIGMGVLPLQITDGSSIQSLKLQGDEIIDIEGLESVEPKSHVDVQIRYADGSVKKISTIVRIETEFEIQYLKSGGILNYVLKNMSSQLA